MFIDQSRIKDIEFLRAELDKPMQHSTHDNKDLYEQEVIRKKRMAKTLKKIYREMQDPKLCRLRELLWKAHLYSDKEWIWKYTNQIKDYLKEPQIEEGTI